MRKKKEIRYSLLMLLVLMLCIITNVHAQRPRWEAPASASAVKNPYSGDATMTETGKILYQKNCIVCHGNTGKGDGVAAVGLNVKPANHTSPLVQQQSDGVLFYKITNGRTPMPSFKNILSEKQRWALVNYIRTLSKNKGITAKSKGISENTLINQ